MEIVRELPENVTLSPLLKERADFFFIVREFGISYYVAATPHVRRLLELDSKGRGCKPDRRIRWGGHQKEDAVRDIISALHLQVRDVVLAGIEEDVTQTLLSRMREVMAPTVRAHVENSATKRAALLLKEQTGETP